MEGNKTYRELLNSPRSDRRTRSFALFAVKDDSLFSLQLFFGHCHGYNFFFFVCSERVYKELSACLSDSNSFRFNFSVSFWVFFCLFLVRGSLLKKSPSHSTLLSLRSTWRIEIDLTRNGSSQETRLLTICHTTLSTGSFSSSSFVYPSRQGDPSLPSKWVTDRNPSSRPRAHHHALIADILFLEGNPCSQLEIIRLAIIWKFIVLSPRDPTSIPFIRSP